MPVPVRQVQLNFADSIDYYRPIHIRYVRDSVNTDKGWHYNYTTLATGTMSPLESNSFNFEETILQELQIIIKNEDNAPLTFTGATVKGYQQFLKVRFAKAAKYSLAYGKATAVVPNYDIQQFTEKIPKTTSTLDFGPEMQIFEDELDSTSPFFENKFWLWGIMGIIILILGWFSLKMIKNK